MVVPPGWLLTLTVAVNALGVTCVIATADSACGGVGVGIPGLDRSAMNTPTTTMTAAAAAAAAAASVQVISRERRRRHRAFASSDVSSSGGIGGVALAAVGAVVDRRDLVAVQPRQQRRHAAEFGNRLPARRAATQVRLVLVALTGR